MLNHGNRTVENLTLGVDGPRSAERRTNAPVSRATSFMEKQLEGRVEGGGPAEPSLVKGPLPKAAVSPGG